MSEKQSLQEFIDSLGGTGSSERKYSLDLEKRDLADVVREFNMLLIKLESGIPADAPENIIKQLQDQRNSNIDDFIEYLKAKKY